LNGFRSIASLTVINGLGAVIGVANTVVLAYLFGTARQIEVYFAAVALLAAVTQLAQSGQLAEVFLPAFQDVRHRQGRESAFSGFAATANWVCVLTLPLILLLWVLAPVLIAWRVPGFSVSDMALGVLFLQALLPLFPLEILSNLIKTVANAERWFGVPEMISVLSRLVGLAAIVAFYQAYDEWALILALWIAQGFQFFGLVVLLHRKGYRHRLVLSSEYIRAWPLFAKLLKTFPYVIATQSYLFVLDAALSNLPQGTFAVFRYVRQLYSRSSWVFLRPVGVVFFSHFSNANVTGGHDLQRMAREALAQILAVCSLVVLAVAVSSSIIVRVLWSSDRFGDALLQTAAVLLPLMFALLFADAIALIMRRITVSLGFVGRQYVGATIVQIISAAAVFLLVSRYGVTGAVSVLYVNCLGMALASYLVLCIWKRDLALLFSFDCVWRWAVSAGLGYGVVRLAAAHPEWPDIADLTRFENLGLGAVTVAAACGTALIIGWLLNIAEVRFIAAKIVNRLIR